MNSHFSQYKYCFCVHLTYSILQFLSHTETCMQTLSAIFIYKATFALSQLTNSRSATRSSRAAQPTVYGCALTSCKLHTARATWSSTSQSAFWFVHKQKSQRTPQRKHEKFTLLGKKRMVGQSIFEKSQIFPSQLLCYLSFCELLDSLHKNCTFLKINNFF